MRTMCCLSSSSGRKAQSLFKAVDRWGGGERTKPAIAHWKDASSELAREERPNARRRRARGGKRRAMGPREEGQARGPDYIAT